ncbi:MAG: hypothetical protein A4E73_02380 [Syntrophaceae bacterium PtaU1.Bin231]|nr:MAG: hypothetical protein A4E73_02380 [Syntrophaceae bacterium PtaU1.Bin231]HOG18537.1 hypothetical protein [Syntrophales bacterium]
MKTTTDVAIREDAEEVTDWDGAVYRKLVSVALTDQQIEWILNPRNIFEREDSVLAVHWHPEMVPVDLVRERIRKMFPNAQRTLVIPTQHNEILHCNGYAGTEVDCQAKEFNRKIQLLFHIKTERLDQAHIFKAMIAHTYQYRQRQLFEYLETVTNPKFEARLQKAVRATGVERDIVRFVQIYSRKIQQLIDANSAETPMQPLKNKLVTNYFEHLREFYPEAVIDKAVVFLLEVKRIVKRGFSPDYFYSVQETIEEARSVGAGIVVPHPEQFWPVLLAEYDVDGIEVWNPQSREFTEFLIHVVVRSNKTRRRSRPLLVFMGDDTHMSEKFLAPETGVADKIAREVGYQPAWQEMGVRKILKMGDFDRIRVIEEYENRLQ